MLTVQRARAIVASPQQLWDVLGDPHHLPRWWPRVSRVEAVGLTDTGEPEVFTEVLMGSSGKVVRADFDVLAAESHRRIVWSQRVENTPFARVLRSSETEITLTGPPAVRASAELAEEIAGEELGMFGSEGTHVSIELRQELQGFSPKGGSWIHGISRFGSPLVRRAAASTIEEALDGLERIVGGART
ncbi:MAG TPA: SRPBCC family protein [Solirubrobacteraceae bacterium]